MVVGYGGSIVPSRVFDFSRKYLGENLRLLINAKTRDLCRTHLRFSGTESRVFVLIISGFSCNKITQNPEISFTNLGFSPLDVRVIANT